MITRQSVEDSLVDAIKIMTDAARRRRPDGPQSDFADFVARVLASTAANVGGPDCLVAGRPGSWEADCVRRLIEGVMGTDPHYWQGLRTEPINVTLNVAELIEASGLHPGLLGLDAAMCALDRAYSQAHDGDTAAAAADLEQQFDQLESRYRTEYRLYGERFADAVRAVAITMNIETVIDVAVDADPQSLWWQDTAINNPDPWLDPIVDELWERGHDAVSVPNVDLDTQRTS
jgi:hypothetical protein